MSGEAAKARERTVGFSSLVPRRSLLIRCPREVWERVGERTRSRRVSLGDVTARMTEPKTPGD